MLEPALVVVTEASQVGEARRTAASFAALLGFAENLRGEVGIVVTELATNLVKHASEGQLILIPVERPGSVCLEVLALDKGPGMISVDRCLADGYSTAGSPGNGLGAISRLADDFEVFSTPGLGTAILARIRAKPSATAATPSGNLDLGAVCLPKLGETACGDAWAVAESGGRSVILMVDGLGHGPQAAEAAAAAVSVFLENARDSAVEIVKAAHAALKPTRGAVIAVTEIDHGRGVLRYVGLGNISGCIVDGEASQSMVSLSGTAGHEARKFQEFTYAWNPDSLLVLHSDGLATHWRLDAYPGLARRDPALIAGLLYRDFTRARDDVTVVVARNMHKHTGS